MAFKSIVGAACTCLAAVSFNVGAEIISIDWKNTDDNLITQDSVSGLDWLDLTETTDMSYNFVSSQLGAGNQFSGFRYATNSEVIALWANFGIDLREGAPIRNDPIVYTDPAIGVAASFLGNIATYGGAIGITANESAPLRKDTLGAAIDRIPPGFISVYVVEGYSGGYLYDQSFFNIGSYLVRPSAVPVPAAIWLFGSGLLGLIGFAKRKA